MRDPVAERILALIGKRRLARLTGRGAGHQWKDRVRFGYDDVSQRGSRGRTEPESQLVEVERVRGDDRVAVSGEPEGVIQAGETVSKPLEQPLGGARHAMLEVLA